MPAEPCTRHPSCALPVHLTPADVELVEQPARDGLDGLGRPHRPWISVEYRGRRVGTLVDRGFHAHPSRGGHWIPIWDAFAGGTHIHVYPDVPGECAVSRGVALRTLLDYVTRAAFAWRCALH